MTGRDFYDDQHLLVGTRVTYEGPYHTSPERGVVTAVNEASRRALVRYGGDPYDQVTPLSALRASDGSALSTDLFS